MLEIDRRRREDAGRRDEMKGEEEPRFAEPELGLAGEDVGEAETARGREDDEGGAASGARGRRCAVGNPVAPRKPIGQPCRAEPEDRAEDGAARTDEVRIDVDNAHPRRSAYAESSAALTLSSRRSGVHTASGLQGFP